MRGCRPRVLAHLLSDIEPASQADQALCTNDNDEATLLLAERDNLSLFSHCQRSTVNDTALDALDRSNQIIQLLLTALSKSQSSAFEFFPYFLLFLSVFAKQELRSHCLIDLWLKLFQRY